MCIHVTIQTLLVLQAFATEAAQESPNLLVGLDVLSQLAPLLESFATFVADVFAESRLNIIFVHPNLVLKLKLFH